MHSPPVQRTVVGDVGQLIELKIGARIGATMTHASPMRGRAAPAHLGAGAARWGMLAAPASPRVGATYRRVTTRGRQ